MKAKNRSKISFNADDTWRTVLTDTAPFELPIILSNDGFYLNLHRKRDGFEEFKTLVEILVTNEPTKYALPYRYNITKSSESTRTLSLLHPRSQAQIADFYEQ